MSTTDKSSWGVRQAPPALRAFLWSLLLVLLAAAVARQGLPHISADNLYGYCFLQDLLDPDTPIAWSLPHSPYFFPDLLLVLPGVLLHAGIAATYHIAFALHVALLWGALAGLGYVLNPTIMRRNRAAATHAIVLYLASILLYRHFNAAPVYFPTMHGNALPLGIALLALGVRILFSKSPRLPSLLFVLLGSLAFLSDEIVLVQFAVPMAGATLFLAAARRLPWRRAAFLLVLVAAAAVTDRLLYALLDRWPELLLKRPYVGLSVDGVLTLARALLRQSPRFLRDGIPALLATAVWIAGLAGLARQPGESNQTRVWCHAALLLVMPCTVGATLGGLLVAGHAAVPHRYLLPIFFVPFAGLAVAETLPSVSRRFSRIVPGMVLATSVAGLAVTTQHPGQWSTPYPGWVRETDAAATRYGLATGFASYNRAKPLASLSRVGLQVAPLRGGLPYVWIDNSYNFLDLRHGTPRLEPRDFILAQGFNPRRLRAVYGRPARIVRTSAGKPIWIYDANAGRPMNLSHFLGSLQTAIRDYGYPIDFFVAPAHLRLEAEDLARPIALNRLPAGWTDTGASALRPGRTLLTPWQRLPAGNHQAIARVASPEPARVTFGLGPNATRLLAETSWQGTAPGGTNLHVELSTEGLTDLRLVVRNDGDNPVLIDVLELRERR